MVEDALEAELEVLVVGRTDVVTLRRHLGQQRRGFGVDRHRFLDVARSLVGRPVLVPKPLQHHRSADMHRHRGVRVERVLGREACLHQAGDRLLHLLDAELGRPRAERRPNENQVAQNRVAHERLSHRARMIAQRLAPILGLDVGRGEDILAQRAIRHRIEQIVLLAEVPVDARDSDAEVLTEQRHAQVVDADLFRKLECALDDVVGIDGPALASLTLLSGCLLGHEGHLHQYQCCARSPRARGWWT